MKGKINLYYSTTFDGKFEIALEWTNSNGNPESLFKHSTVSWEDAKQQAIAEFKAIPPSEELEVE